MPSVPSPPRVAAAVPTQRGTPGKRGLPFRHDPHGRGRHPISDGAVRRARRDSRPVGTAVALHGVRDDESEVPSPGLGEGVAMNEEILLREPTEAYTTPFTLMNRFW